MARRGWGGGKAKRLGGVYYDGSTGCLQHLGCISLLTNQLKYSTQYQLKQAVKHYPPGHLILQSKRLRAAAVVNSAIQTHQNATKEGIIFSRAMLLALDICKTLLWAYRLRIGVKFWFPTTRYLEID